MRSVADDLRAETRERVAELDPQARLALSLTLGDEDLELLSAARQISRDEAVEHIRRTRHLGRRRSASSEGGAP